MDEQRPSQDNTAYRNAVLGLIDLYANGGNDAKGKSGRASARKNTLPKQVTPEHRHQFIDVWVALAEATGIDDQTIGYLCDGFQIAAAEPLYRYVEKTHDIDAYTRLDSFERIKESKDHIGLKICMSLFAFELGRPTTDSSMQTATENLLTQSMGKDGRRLPAFKSAFTQLIVKPLTQSNIAEDARLEKDEAEKLFDALDEPMEDALSKLMRRNVKRPETAKAIEMISQLEEWTNCQIDGEQYVPKPLEDATVEAEMRSKTHPRQLGDVTRFLPKSAPTAAPKQLPKDTSKSTPISVPVGMQKDVSETNELSTAPEKVDPPEVKASEDSAPKPTVIPPIPETTHESEQKVPGIPEILGYLKAHQEKAELLSNENDELRRKLHELNEQMAELSKENEEQRQGLETARARIAELEDLLSPMGDITLDPEAE